MEVPCAVFLDCAKTPPEVPEPVVPRMVNLGELLLPSMRCNHRAASTLDVPYVPKHPCSSLLGCLPSALTAPLLGAEGLMSSRAVSFIRNISFLLLMMTMSRADSHPGRGRRCRGCVPFQHIRRELSDTAQVSGQVSGQDGCR